MGARVREIRVNKAKGSTLLSTYVDSLGFGDVTDREIRFAVKRAAAVLKYEEQDQHPLDAYQRSMCNVHGQVPIYCLQSVVNESVSVILGQGGESCW